MAGIYIHIPFCRKACIYCNFHFTTSIKAKKELIEAINKDIELRKDYLNNEQISTIYFGGGTPSYVDSSEIEIILSKIYKNFSIKNDPEITIEGNPDDLIERKLIELKQIGINRLSIGVQSFSDDDLNYLGRTHNSKTAEKSILIARDIGFSNITADLIYGIPGSDNSRWNNNLHKILELKIPHFSAYALTIEPKTIMAYKIKKGVLSNPEEEQIRTQYFELKHFANQNAFLHYEISNFGKEDFFSRHNSSYWRNEKYLGIGPSAHSYDLYSRQWNFSVNSEYIKGVNSGKLYYTKENLSLNDKFNEYLIITLRTMWGMDLDLLELNFKEIVSQDFYKTLDKHLKKKHLMRTDNKIHLTDEGILFSDGIISELMV